MKLLLLSALAGLAFSCRCVVPLHQAMNDLREAGYRSWNSDEDVSLLTPWNQVATGALQEEIARSLSAIEKEFRTELPRPLHVSLNPVEGGLGESAATSTIHGVEAFAVASQNSVVVFVRDDAESLDGDERLMNTLQHEVAHLASARIGLKGKTWFREGLAMEVEYASIQRGRLVHCFEPESLKMAQRIHHDVELAQVLHWAEDGGAVLEGEAEAFLMGRPLAHSLLRFLLVHRGARVGAEGQFLEALLEIDRLSEGEILALEPEWHEWLEETVSES